MSNLEITPETARTASVGPTIIQPHSDQFWPNFPELYRFRGLLAALVSRNVRVRYKNTALGAVWVLLSPLMQMLVYTLIFGFWARIPVHGIPYSVHVLSGLVLAFFFNRVLAESANVIRANQSLTRKVYFPKLILPITLTASAVVDLVIALGLLFVIMLIQGVHPGIRAFLAPLFLLALLGWAFACGVWLAALGIRFRDVALLTPILTMLLMYLSPIVYPLTAVPERYQMIYALNPMVGIVTGFRWSLLGVEPFYPQMILISVAESVLIGLYGLIYFVRTERTFNDFL